MIELSHGELNGLVSQRKTVLLALKIYQNFRNVGLQ